MATAQPVLTRCLLFKPHHLTRVFAGGQGVRDLDLDVPEGATYGFVGPNGAGKTTTIRLILGLLRSDAGEVRLFDRVLTRRDRTALSTTGALVENPSLYPHLSARDNLEVTRRLIGAPRSRIKKVLQIVGLDEDAHRRVRDYSLGMRQRLGIALALLNQPRLLILDEPTNGLDPAGIASMRQFIRHMVNELGVSVFLSSHLLIEVEQLASHVGVIHEGRLLFQGPIENLRATSVTPLEVACTDSAAALRLRDPAFFARYFIELGALAWPNGLDFSAGSLHQHLQDEGKLQHSVKAA